MQQDDMHPLRQPSMVRIRVIYKLSRLTVIATSARKRSKTTIISKGVGQMENVRSMTTMKLAMKKNENELLKLSWRNWHRKIRRSLQRTSKSNCQMKRSVLRRNDFNGLPRSIKGPE